MFFDQAKIYVKSGDGGDGAMAFRREKFVPRGGPAGGNGGRGGHIYFVVDAGLNTLSAFKQKIHFRAERGTHGGGANKTGANGDDLRIGVPPGTLIRNADTGEVLADLTRPGQEILLLQGGRGGRGNSSFKSAQNKAPRLSERGEHGMELWLELELKLVADVGIIGVPNAGKSTLLSVVSAAKPKIAEYPFTTVVPNLGVAEVNHRQMVLADIPGLMEGAHEGIGLGHDFLRHIERTRVLIHLLNGDSPDPLGDFEAINQELTLFNPALADKPQIVVFNKMDLPHAREQWPAVEKAIVERGLACLNISAVTGHNVEQMLYRVQEMLDALPVFEEIAVEELPEITPAADERAFQITPLEDDTWLVEGIAIERAAQMTNWDYYEAAMRFQRILDAMGISKALKNAGVADGDTIQIGDTELIWGYENAFGE
ncbi:MAG: GTPase ObgE [Caldilineaceae bacterium]|nr:GTPase ObgE [Caldilineaceae bacterium]MCB0140909.1 GTPase ObgE [Caldilineaceae bacterium]